MAFPLAGQTRVSSSSEPLLLLPVHTTTTPPGLAALHVGGCRGLPFHTDEKLGEEGQPDQVRGRHHHRCE